MIKALAAEGLNGSETISADATYASQCSRFDEKLEEELSKVARFYEMKKQWSLAQMAKHQRALSAVVRLRQAPRAPLGTYSPPPSSS